LPVPIQLKDIEKLEAEMGEPKANPAWLLALLAAEKTKATAFAGAAKTERNVAMKNEETLAKRLDASVDDPDAKHPIHILVLSEDSDFLGRTNKKLEAHRFEVKPKMRIWVGEFNTPASDLKNWVDNTDREPRNDKQGIRIYRSTKMSIDDSKIVVDGNSLEIQRSLEKGIRIVATSGETGLIEVYFEFRISPPSLDIPQIFAGKTSPYVFTQRAGEEMLIVDEISVVERIQIVGQLSTRVNKIRLIGGENSFEAIPASLGGKWKVIPIPAPQLSGHRTSTDVRKDLEDAQSLKKREEASRAEEAKRNLSKQGKSSLGQKKLDAIEVDIAKFTNELTNSIAEEAKLVPLFPKPGVYAVETSIIPKGAKAPRSLRLVSIELRSKDTSKPSPK